MAADQKFTSLLDRLETITNRLEKIPVKGSQGAVDDQGNTEIVDAFDKLIDDKVKKYLNNSNKIGGEVSKHAEKVKKAFDAERSFLVLVSKCKTPKPELVPKLMQPISIAIKAVQEFRDENRASKFFNHLSGIYEAIPCLGWVTVGSKPAHYVKEVFNSAQFYTNRVLKEFKGVDENHVEWTRSISGVINGLIDYITDYHGTGLAWNADGKDPSAVSVSSPPPPPPPSGVPPPLSVASSNKADGKDSHAALFSSINVGGNITSGLKKVSDDMKTHKNPNLRSSSAVSEKAAVSKAPVSAKQVARGSPVFRLEGKKWLIENQDGNHDLIISDTNAKQTVYIFRCHKCTIKVEGKVNAITIDSCTRTAVVFDQVISTVESLNSQNIQVQVTGNAPTVSIDKTDGMHVYLGKESMNSVIVSAKSSEMNVSIFKNDDLVEYALPEQYKSVWDPRQQRFVTTTVDINL